MQGREERATKDSDGEDEYGDWLGYHQGLSHREGSGDRENGDC
jgi:hypothetical protein